MATLADAINCAPARYFTGVALAGKMLREAYPDDGTVGDIVPQLHGWTIARKQYCDQHGQPCVNLWLLPLTRVNKSIFDQGKINFYKKLGFTKTEAIAMVKCSLKHKRALAPALLEYARGREYSIDPRDERRFNQLKQYYQEKCLNNTTPEFSGKEFV